MYIYIFILTHVCNMGSATPMCIVESLLFQSTPLGQILNQSGQTAIRGQYARWLWRMGPNNEPASKPYK